METIDFSIRQDDSPKKDDVQDKENYLGYDQDIENNTGENNDETNLSSSGDDDSSSSSTDS